MKGRCLIFAFSLLAVFYLSSENVSAASCDLCKDACPGGYSYWKECGGGGTCGACQSSGTTFCYNGNNVYEFYLGTTCNPLTGTQVQCIGLKQACSAPTPRCYDTGSSASCVECLSNTDCTAPKVCDAGTRTCYTPTCSSCSDGTAKDSCSTASPGNRCVDAGGGNCQLQTDATCAPSCSSCSDGTAKGACSTSDRGKRCNDIGGGNCQLQTDSTCASTCPDGTPAGSCCTSQAGKRCQASTLTCVSDSSCPSCVDTDPSDDPKVKGTCTDTAGGVCNGGGCTDTCASSSAATEYYCSGSTCTSKQVSCAGGTYCSGGSCGTTSSSGCSWWSSTFSVCSSGCPSSYPDQQFVCCESIGYSQCNGNPACASYNPIKGETPCCTEYGYYTCTKQQTCTPTGCQSVCTGADKTSALYCSRCNSCQDGIQNCGEPSVDRCGNPCTVAERRTYTTPGSYGGYTCAAIGNSKCQYYNPGYYDIACIRLVSCSYGEYGCVWECQGTTDVFNPASCSDDVQNCKETALDCGTVGYFNAGDISQSCNTGAKETDNSYLVTFEFTEPPGLTGTRLYTDALSWNCMDGTDNDKDCTVDCGDPDCSTALSCSDSTPPSVNVAGAPASWQNTSATAVVSCTDSGSGCNTGTYRLYISATTLSSCPPSYSSYISPSPSTITARSWVCAAAKDNIGNVGISSPAEFKIETDPPATAIVFEPPAANSKGWYTTEVNVTLSCTDILSGCTRTRYRINGETWKTYSSKFALGSDGIQTIEYYSEDNAGNVEAIKSAIAKVYLSPPFSMVFYSPRLTTLIGAQGQAIITVKNLMNVPDIVSVSLVGLPSKLHRWIWFTGHKEDSNRYKLALQLQPGEERAVPINVFGGEFLSGGRLNVTGESDTTGVTKDIGADVEIAYSENGLNVQTPEFGWLGFALVALLGALLI